MNERGPWLECRELDGKDTFHFHKDQEDFISMTMDEVDGFVSSRVARSVRLHAVRVVEGVAPPPFVRQPNLERLGGYAGFFGLLLVSVLAAAATGLLGSSAGLGAGYLLLPCVAAAGIAPFVAPVSPRPARAVGASVGVADGAGVGCAKTSPCETQKKSSNGASRS